MCRSIETLHNFGPPPTDDEIRPSALQFVRKLSGFAHELLDSLTTNAPPRDREVEASKAKARAADRFHSADAKHAEGHRRGHDA